jgi:hypothetical protein
MANTLRIQSSTMLSWIRIPRLPRQAAARIHVRRHCAGHSGLAGPSPYRGAPALSPASVWRGTGRASAAARAVCRACWAARGALGPKRPATDEANRADARIAEQAAGALSGRVSARGGVAAHGRYLSPASAGLAHFFGGITQLPAKFVVYKEWKNCYVCKPRENHDWTKT